MFVSDEGEILDPPMRIFSKQAIEEKNNFNLKNKLKKNIVKSNKRKYENAFLNETSIIPDYLANLEKKERISQSTSSAIVSNSYLQTWENASRNNCQPSTSGNNFQTPTSGNALTSHFERSTFSPYRQQQMPVFEKHVQLLNSTRTPNIQQEISGLHFQSETKRISDDGLKGISSLKGNVKPPVSVTPSSVHKHDITTSQGNVQSQNSEHQKTSTQHGYLKSYEIDKITNTQVHHRVPLSITPPAITSDIIRSSLNEDKTATCGKVNLSNNDDENKFSSSSEDEDLNNENWSGSINAMAATFPGIGNFSYIFSVFSLHLTITSLYLYIKFFLSYSEGYCLSRTTIGCNEVFL